MEFQILHFSVFGRLINLTLVRTLRKCCSVKAKVKEVFVLNLPGVAGAICHQVSDLQASTVVGYQSTWRTATKGATSYCGIILLANYIYQKINTIIILYSETWVTCHWTCTRYHRHTTLPLPLPPPPAYDRGPSHLTIQWTLTTSNIILILQMIEI